MINPFLCGAWISVAIAKSAPRPPWRFMVATVVAAVLAVFLAEQGKAHVVWPGNPYFPSGHETFESSVATSICLAERRWILLAIVACLLLGWALIAVHYHKLSDVSGGVALGTLVTVATHKLALKRPRSRRKRTV